MNPDQRKVIEELLDEEEYDCRWSSVQGRVHEQRVGALRALLDAYDQTTANLSATQAHATALLERARAAESVLADVVRMGPDTTVSALAWMPVDARDIKRARALIAARGTGQTPGAVEKTQYCPLCVATTKERDEARAYAERLRVELRKVDEPGGQLDKLLRAVEDAAHLEARHRELQVSELRVVGELAAERKKTQALEADLAAERARGAEMRAAVESILTTFGAQVGELMARLYQARGGEPAACEVCRGSGVVQDWQGFSKVHDHKPCPKCKEAR